MEYGVQSKGKRPHITFADYDNIDKKIFSDMLDSFYKGKPQIDITLNILGTFINTGTLFISPIFSKKLIDFHNKYHTCFEAFNDNEKSLYLPDKWNPHCTIASRLDENNMMRAFKYCKNNLNKISGKISEIALIEIELNNNGIAIEDRVIISKLLI